MQDCEGYKQFNGQYRKILTSDTYRPNAFNFTCQIDFIGLMETGFQKKYACTMVDIHTGIGIAVACMNPDAKATIQTLARWCSHYGAPRIIESDSTLFYTFYAILIRQVPFYWSCSSHILQNLLPNKNNELTS